MRKVSTPKILNARIIKKKVITILKTEALLLFNYLTSDLEFLITKLGYKKEINFYPLNFG